MGRGGKLDDNGKWRRQRRPWHFLYFLPEPQGHGSFTPIFLLRFVGLLQFPLTALIKARFVGRQACHFLVGRIEVAAEAEHHGVLAVDRGPPATPV